MKIPSLSFWQIRAHDLDFGGVGDATLLGGPLTAFFASRTCLGTAIRAAVDWVVTEARASHTLISGFQSSQGRSVLEMLLKAHSKVVVALARDVAKARLSGAWREAASRNEIAIVSITQETRRLTEDHASERNEWVATIADRIAIAHAEPGGQLDRDAKRWQDQGRKISLLASPA